MGMSTSVKGFKPPDDKWKKMKEVYDACAKAGVPEPSEVSKFFGYDKPDPAGVTVEEDALIKCGAVKEYSADMQDGYEIDVKRLPPDVTIIRVYNSY